MIRFPFRSAVAAAVLAGLVACGSSDTAPIAFRNSTLSAQNVADVFDSAAPVPASAGRDTLTASGTTVLFHEFKTECDTQRNDADRDARAGEAAFIDAAQDPILFPGKAAPPMQHVHTFFGNLSVNPNVDLATLMAAPSTCNMMGGHEAWWIPQANLDGVPIHPSAIVVYYKMGPDGFNAHVTPFAGGVRILAGKATQTEEDFRKIGSWTCGTLPRTGDVPDSCAPGTDLVVRLGGPHCMADTNATDSPTHRTHIASSVSGPAGEVCPADHPIAVPMPVWKISYAVSGDNLKRRLRFSAMRPDGSVGPAGPAWSFHADEIFAFDATRFAHLVDYCINGGRQCQHTGDGPHLTR